MSRRSWPKWLGLRRLLDRSRNAVLGLGVLAVALLGVLGWRLTDPQLPWDDVFYQTLTLFAFNFSTDEPISRPLNFARFLAPFVLSSALLVVAFQVIGRQRTLRKLRTIDQHVVVLGDGPEAARIACRFRTEGPHKVVLLGELSASDQIHVVREGVVHAPAVSVEDLRKALAGSSRLIVAAENDESAVLLAQRVRQAVGSFAPGTTVLFTDRDLAMQWSRTGMIALCRSAQLAIAVLRGNPPYLEVAMVPPPIVIGDGPVAAEIARGIVVGWQQPGERVCVHVVGHDLSWAKMAAIGVEDRVDFVEHQMSPHAGNGPKVVDAILRSWQAPPTKFATQGPSIYVAYPDSARTVPIATAIAEYAFTSASSPARVMAIVEDEANWEGTFVEGMAPQLLSGQVLLSDPAVLTLDRAGLLASGIIADAGRWPTDIETALGPIRHGSAECATLDGQRPEVREAVLAVVADIERILDAGGIALRSGPLGTHPSIILEPHELLNVANVLEQVLPSRGDQSPAEDELRRLEFASRLPVLAARAGWVPTRKDGRRGVFTDDILQSLAEAAHETYLGITELHGSAGSINVGRAWDKLTEVDRRSNLAQAAELPVKLAALGLTVRERTDAPYPVVLKAAEIELLARLEHRRWMHFQFRNGRPNHPDIRPYDELTPEKQELDKEVAKHVRAHLAAVGLEIVAIQQAQP